MLFDISNDEKNETSKYLLNYCHVQGAMANVTWLDRLIVIMIFILKNGESKCLAEVHTANK
jgi:hypothetical protein